MAKGIIKKLDIVYKNVSITIADNAAQGKYATALAGEGYNDGYRQAIMDVTLALNGGHPRTNYWWPDNR